MPAPSATGLLRSEDLTPLPGERMRLGGEHDAPKVWFAIEGKVDEGWHEMTSMDAK